MHVEICYDPAKDARNVTERGLSFERAVDFGFETALFWIDTRKPYPELRVSALGLLEGRVHSLVFSETDDGIRVISFRKANQREVRRYEEANQT